MELNLGPKKHPDSFKKKLLSDLIKCPKSQFKRSFIFTFLNVQKFSLKAVAFLPY